MRFNRAAAKALAAIDATRLVSLTIDGHAIAFVWYIALERRMYLYRTAFDPAFSRCSPGILNTLNVLELAAEEGLTRVEFLGGAERYKLEFADRLEPLHLGLGLPGSGRGSAVVASRAGWLGFRALAKNSGAARRIYDHMAPVRRRVKRSADVLRPSGVAEQGR